MRVLQVNYDNNEMIKDVSVNMTLNEAIALVNITGKLNGHAIKRLNLSTDESLFDALNNMFNMHYDEGYPELDNLELEAINLSDRS